MTLVPVAPLTHLVGPPVEVRDDEDDGDGRTLVGLAVPFDVELDVADFWDEYTEVFRKGSFRKTIRDRSHPVQLMISHEHRGLPIGRATELREEDDGLHATFHLTENVQRADEVLALVKDGTLFGLSIGFEPVTHKVTPGERRTPPSRRDLHERTEVRLREVSVCNFPAYREAGVTEVRNAWTGTVTMAYRGGHDESEVRAAQEGHPSLGRLAEERARLHEERSVLVDRFGRVVRH